jgi:hypothetical protein
VRLNLTVRIEANSRKQLQARVIQKSGSPGELKGRNLLSGKAPTKEIEPAKRLVLEAIKKQWPWEMQIDWEIKVH